MQRLSWLNSRSSGSVFGTAPYQKECFLLRFVRRIFSESVNIDIRMGRRHTDAKRVSDLSDTAY